jgi:ABC-2 type transport system ATP-binding protein
MKDTAIMVRNVHKSFRNSHVLDDVSMTVESGEMIGIVGNNGSGKSVLLKCICGLIRPDSGQIKVSGKVIGNDIDFPDGVGAIIESPGFMPQRSGYTNLKYLWSINRKQPMSVINESMRIVGLDPKLKRRVGKYSMGMRQRLGLAQALMEHPNILILDEPFNGLDKHALQHMRMLVKQLNEEGKTIIITSHNPQDIDTCCTKVYELDEGKMTPSEASSHASGY